MGELISNRPRTDGQSGWSGTVSEPSCEMGNMKSADNFQVFPIFNWEIVSGDKERGGRSIPRMKHRPRWPTGCCQPGRRAKTVQLT